MSILSDYHGKATRSRAMSLHQTGVYAGTVGGSALAGLLAERYGWRSPFWILGIVGMVYAVLLIPLIREPTRGAADEKGKPSGDDLELPSPRVAPSPRHNLRVILGTPSACVLLSVFAGANFVAAVMLTWLPEFVYSKFHLGVARSTFAATVLHLASLGGAICSSLITDSASRLRGGRMLVQAAALLVGAPWVLLLGWTGHFPLFVMAMIGAGFCKGLYDANIFASVYDVVSPEVRGTAAGLMNTVAWAGGSVAPWAIGRMADRYGLSQAIASTSSVYVAAGLLAIIAARLAPPAGQIGAQDVGAGGPDPAGG
jgi:MFS family permease